MNEIFDGRNSNLMVHGNLLYSQLFTVYFVIEYYLVFIFCFNLNQQNVIN